MKNTYIMIAVLAASFYCQSVPGIACSAQRDSFMMLKKGAEITLELFEDASSQSHNNGNTVEMSVYKDVTLRGAILINSGRYAQGEVKWVQKAGVFGRPGRIAIRPLNVESVDGQLIPLESAEVVFVGEDRRIFAWGSGLLLPALGFIVLSAFAPPLVPAAALLLGIGLFIKGKGAKVAAKTRLRAKVSRDTKIRI